MSVSKAFKLYSFLFYSHLGHVAITVFVGHVLIGVSAGGCSHD